MTDSTENDRRTMFKEAVRNVEYCAELVAKQLQGEDRNSQLNELKTVMLEYCELDNNWQLERKVLGDIERTLTEENDIEKVDEMYANLRRKQSEADPKKHEWYLGIEKKIKQWIGSEGDADCDIVAGSSTQSLLDPFTKRPMTDPVRNTLCGHSYERITILTILQNKKQMRCPVVGCANRNNFQECHLEDNTEMARQIERKLEEEELNRSRISVD